MRTYHQVIQIKENTRKEEKKKKRRELHENIKIIEKFLVVDYTDMKFSHKLK